MANKRRRLGDVLLDLEKVLEEMVDSHDLQWSDVIFLVFGWLQVHRPGAQEKYLDGSHPVLYYQPQQKEKS